MIQVLIVDDSAVLRQQLKFILQSDPELKVVGEARNGQEAIALAKQLKPNVITMDITMPKMNGLEAIRHIMAECPTPIVVVTSRNLEREMDLRSQVTRLGAVSILKTPDRTAGPKYQDMAAEIIQQVKLMSQVKVITRSKKTLSHNKIQIIAIGSSTGGPAALYQILGALPAKLDIPVLIVQHISFGFVEGLAGWLSSGCQLPVKVIQHGEKLRPGTIYLAPDNYHIVADTFGRVRLRQDEPVNNHRPSVTVLFESVAQAYGSAAMAVILTGMGNDGAASMQALKQAGATTLAQDEQSCVVFGMPKEAIASGAVKHIVPLEKMSQTMMSLCGTI